MKRKKMYMVIRYVDSLSPDDYGVSDSWSLILLTSDEGLAKEVQEQEQNNKEFEEYNSMRVEVVEITSEKVYSVEDEVVIGGVCYIE